MPTRAWRRGVKQNVHDAIHAGFSLAGELLHEVPMERCLTILPPPPSWLTTVRAALGARWFRSASAMRCALRRTKRASMRAVIVVNERVTPMKSLHACDALAAPSSADRITAEDDRWLRPTETLPLNV